MAPLTLKHKQGEHDKVDGGEVDLDAENGNQTQDTLELLHLRQRHQPGVGLARSLCLDGCTVQPAILWGPDQLGLARHHAQWGVDLMEQPRILRDRSLAVCGGAY